MRKSWADAARVAEVRHAARSWRDANVIDAATLETIETAYPDARPRLAPVWKVLIFVLVSVAVHAVFFGLMEITRSTAATGVILFGLVLAAVTEALRSSRFAGNGSDASASLWAVTYLLVGLGVLWSTDFNRGNEGAITFVLIAAVVLFAGACVHWGYAAYGALSAAALFLLGGRFPAGRVAWILAGVILIVIARRRLNHDYPPPLRRAVAAVFAVSALALYVAVNRYSLDERWIEQLRAHATPAVPASEGIRILATIATALVPVVFIVWGIRARRTLILDLGLVFTAASLVTLRYYVHIAPLWALLTLAGTALIVGALRLDRALRLPRGGGREGFTSAPFTSVKGTEALQAAAVIAGFTGSPAAARSGEFSPGGGRFGGGGTSGQF